MKKIAVTLGDPNSISPEITIKAMNFLDLPADRVILIANNEVLGYYEHKFNLSLEKKYEIQNIPFDIKSINPGEETAEAGDFSFHALVKACNLAVNNQISAIITAPVSKNAMNMAGHKYSGQTEILEQYLAQQNQKAEMIFVSEQFSLMLMTRHVPLKNVSDYIKKEAIVERVKKLVISFEKQLNRKTPFIAICALNPHSGENGLIGREEIEEIIPAVKILKEQGINIEGPYSADALFAKCAVQECSYDCYIAMYHDQGLIPVKIFDRDNAVNTTLGLNVLRTSPAHGTAYDIAGKNCANPTGMINAIKFALDCIK